MRGMPISSDSPFSRLQDFLGAPDDFPRHAGDARHFDTVTAAGTAFHNLAQKNNFFRPILSRRCYNFSRRFSSPSDPSTDDSEWQTRSALPSGANRGYVRPPPRRCQAIERGSSPSHFINDHQRPRRGILENLRGFRHFHHKCTLAFDQTVRGADARKILSATPIFARTAGTKLPICAINTISATCRMYVDLPAMFGPVMISNLFSCKSKSVSLGKHLLQRPLHHGMASIFDFYNIVIGDFWTNIAVFFGNLGQCAKASKSASSDEFLDFAYILTDFSRKETKSSCSR